MTTPRSSTQKKRTANKPATQTPTVNKQAATPQSRKPARPKKPGDIMAENNKQSDTASTKAAPSTAIAVRLVENAPVTQPMLVNYCTATVTSGLVMVDLGFLEPAMMAALTRTAKAGGTLPKGVAGKLGARVALTPEAARQLQQQLNRLMAPAQAKNKTIN